MAWMQQNVNTFLQNLLRVSKLSRTEVMVGMSEFHSNADKLHDLVTLNDLTINSLLAAIPRKTKGATAIGAGIRQGLQVQNYAYTVLSKCPHK